jgi:hypothetical protein
LPKLSGVGTDVLKGDGTWGAVPSGAQPSLLLPGPTNPADLLDIGFLGTYVSAGTKYTGLFRDATDGKYKLYHGLTVAPTTDVVDLTSGVLSELLVGTLTATNVSATDLAGTLSTASQPNVTTLAGVTSLNGWTVGSGTLSGGSSISATAITGTLATASQPNITTLAGVTSLNSIPVSSNALGNSSTSLVCGSLQLTTSPGAGYVLTSDASGVASWSAAAGSGVTSITGTSNQIIASAGTGAVTLSTPQDIATTSSPTFAAVTATGSANAQLIQGTFQNTNSGTGAYNEIRVLNDASLGLRLGITSSTYTGWLGDAYIYNGNNAGINFGTNAAGGRMYINAAGNVGIGTTSPTYQLTLGNSRPAVYLVHNVAGTTVMGMQHNGGNAFLLRNNAYRDPTTGVDAQVDAGKDSWDMYTEATSASSNFTVRRAPAGSISWTNLMTLLANGNLGIGTTTPNAPLQFAATVGNRKIVLYDTLNDDHRFYGLGVNSNVFRYQVDGTSSSHVFYAATSSTTSNELMRIAGSGNVGIGTASQVNRLDVASNGQTFGLVGTDHTYMAMYPRGFAGGRKSYIGFGGPATTSMHLMNEDTGSLILGTNASARIWVTATGRVGISTNNPTQTLDVQGVIKTFNNANDVMLLISPDSGNYIRIDAWNIANSVQKNIVLNQSGGNVGIGVSAPTTTLQLWNGSKGGQISLGQQGDPTPYMNMGMDTSWQQYICNNAQWTGSAFNYVNTGGYGGKASRIAQESGNIYFDVAYGGSNPITWDRRLNIQNSGAIYAGGLFQAPTINATSNLQKNGTNIVSLQANAGSWSLNSGTSSYSAGHGLGALPTFVQFHYVCTTADFNWAVGDRLPVSHDSQVSDHVGTPWFNASTIGFRFSAPPRLIAMDKTLNVVRQLTTSSWWMEWKAYREI